MTVPRLRVRQPVSADELAALLIALAVPPAPGGYERWRTIRLAALRRTSLR